MNKLKTIFKLIIKYLTDKSFKEYCDEKINPPMELFGDRSSKWRSVRNSFLANNPNCRVCGTKDELNVHHIIPFHIKPELELEEDNLITLCNKNGCHFAFGHLYNWSSYNPDVMGDVWNFREKVINRK